jgi:predicted dehydrogenase
MAKASKPVNIGIIGAGFIGQVAHLMNYVEVPNCRVTALAEYRPLLRQKLADRYSIPRTYASHHELLKDPDVDAVVVVTPRRYTAPIGLDCLKAGKHLITEKPMAGTLKQGQMLVDAAQAKHLHYAVGYMRRHDEGVQLAKTIFDELTASQELGPVLFARAHCYMGNSYASIDGHIKSDEKTDYPDDGWPVAPDWMPTERASEYAAFLNTYSHNTNLLRYLFNKTPSVDYARLQPGAGQIVVLNFGGFAASLEVGSAVNQTWDETTDIYFAKGHLSIRTFPAFLRNIPAQVTLYKGTDKHETISSNCNWTWAFRRQAQAFVDDISNGRESIASGKDSLEDLSLVEDIWRKEIDRR